MQKYQPDIVIYHDKCMDGFTAAWAVWKRWGDAPEYVARNYGMKPDVDADGKNILIVDFSFPTEDLLELTQAGASSVVVLDHHKTAEAELAAFRYEEGTRGDFSAQMVPGLLGMLYEDQRPPIIAIFDMERSGAGLAWDFSSTESSRPDLVDLVEDRDLWRFAHGDASRHLHLFLTSGEISFDRWDKVGEDVGDFVAEGKAIAMYRDMLVAEISERAKDQMIGGHEGIVVDCPYSLVSDVCHALLDAHPLAAFAAGVVRGQHSTSYSLRSRDDRADVSEIAKQCGGGGHRNAAGFKVPR